MVHFGLLRIHEFRLQVLQIVQQQKRGKLQTFVATVLDVFSRFRSTDIYIYMYIYHIRIFVLQLVQTLILPLELLTSFLTMVFICVNWFHESGAKSLWFWTCSTLSLPNYPMSHAELRHEPFWSYRHQPLQHLPPGQRWRFFSTSENSNRSEKWHKQLEASYDLVSAKLTQNHFLFGGWSQKKNIKNCERLPGKIFLNGHKRPLGKSWWFVQKMVDIIVNGESCLLGKLVKTLQERNHCQKQFKQTSSLHITPTFNMERHGT